jgi:hypothetical protein
MGAAPWIVSDGLWELVEPLLPQSGWRFRYPGRKRLPDREALQGILFVLHTGIAWTQLPQELGFGFGSPAGDAWTSGNEQASGSVCISNCSRGLRAAGELEWSRAVVDSSQIQAKEGAPKRARAQSTEAVRAPSTTSWSTQAGSRSPGRFPGATATTSPN